MNQTPTIKGTSVLKKTRNEYRKGTRVIINEGGTGSSKTYSLCQLFTVLLSEENGVVVSVVRRTMPALRATAMRTFFNLLKELGIYNEKNHNKSENIYFIGTNKIEFFGLDEPHKVRSRRRDYLWINEANELSLEGYRQLSMRTRKQIFLDYNPSHFEHWIYDEVQTKKNCKVIRSTYRDNPYLPETIIKEIESYKDKDPNYWRIYGLGLRGIAETLIYSHWRLCDKLPENYDEVIYGLDFGYNNPTALVKIVIKDDEYYWKEMLYESFMTNSDLIERMKDLKISKNKYIYADASEPQRIEELNMAGFNVIPCNKGRDSVNKGIDYIKSHGFFITKDSLNAQKEAKHYSWKVKNEKPIDEPVKSNDHLMDAGRYAIYTHNIEALPAFPEQDKGEDDKGKPYTSGLLDKDF